MIALWRLSNSQDLRPRGRPPGRWHGPARRWWCWTPVRPPPCSRGWPRPRWRTRALPRHYFLLEVVAPESAIQDSDAPANWLTDLQATRALGNAWLARGETALLRVPSAAGGLQYLLNAEHPQLAQCQIVSALAYPYLPHLTGLDSAVLDGAGWLVTARPGE